MNSCARWCLMLAVTAVCGVSCVDSNGNDDDEMGGAGGEAGSGGGGAAGAGTSNLGGSDGGGGTSSLAGADTVGGASSGATGVPSNVGGGSAGESGNAGQGGRAGQGGDGAAGGPHCVLKADAPCMSTDTACTSGYRCASGECVPGPVAGEPGVGPNQTECAHGFYANAATQHLCVARAPLGTVNCGGVGQAEGPICLEEYPCIFHVIATELRCSERLTEGGLCGTDADCAPGLNCTEMAPTLPTLRCRAPLAIGANCNAGAGACETGSYCDTSAAPFPVCAAYPGISLPCDNGHCTKGALCQAGTCVAPAMLNAPCDSLACADGLVCVGAP